MGFSLWETILSSRTSCTFVQAILWLSLAHVYSLSMIESLADMYITKFNMLSEAEDLSKRVLTEREEWLGPNHIDTLQSVSDLAEIYSRQGDQVREVEMYERALLGYKNTFGTEDKETLWVAQKLRQVLGSSPGEFSMTSYDMILDDDFNLVASCERVDGSRLKSSISLNSLLTKQGGIFAWDTRGNFVATARSIRLRFKDHGTFLAAGLVDEYGVWKDTRVDLDQRIANHDGKLTFVALDEALYGLWDGKPDKESVEEPDEQSDEEPGEELKEELNEEYAPATSSVSQEHSDGVENS